ncbi:RidA family protein [Roseococcus sp. SDR]|uniref:RidA family protein n=1 Tax=Roseococcus sp. SDR TaxID=2835532 RepID=UPI001BD12EE2|nr:RidA family protein [Roseococcus sp. SDR]MBS7790438.1 RidA family protein [Roseococcus sp. SDR]MBV1845752.1 RidA family protein [Roseococcus sp. SDR]
MSRIRRVSSPAVPEPPPGLWSNCLVVDGIAYLSGFTARDQALRAPEGADMLAQARTIFGKMRSLLEAAGGCMADMVKLTIFVTDITQREAVWQARREFFTGDFPACSLVQVAALAEPSILVEIEGVAHLGASRG